MRAFRRHRGFTLVEMMVAVSVVTLLTVTGVPNMMNMMQRRQLEGAAGEVYNNLLLMRSQAIEKNHSAFVSFNGSGLNWSYGLSESASCDPTTSGNCAINGGERVYRSTPWKTVTLSQSFAGNNISFEPRRGLPSASGTIQITSAAGEIDISISPIGYISVCAVGSQRLGGYGTC